MKQRFILTDKFTILGGRMLGGREVPPLTFIKVKGKPTYRAKLKTLEQLRSLEQTTADYSVAK